jgi:O-antigen/teichoic acid export membrane protein
VFNIVTTVSGLGCSSGLVRHLSHHRATGTTEMLGPTLVIALVPVGFMGLLAGGAVAALAGPLAALFSSTSMGAASEELARTLRWMAPFIPVGTVYWVIVQGTRGFDTMRPVVVVDKLGRGILLPVAVGIALSAGLSPAGIAAVWASSTLVALVPAAGAMRALVRDATQQTRSTGQPRSTPDRSEMVRSYWRFTGPRAIGQVSEVSVTWLDTLIVGSVLGAAAAGIYGAGTRYVLPGLFVADAIMQVVGPRISGLLSVGRSAAADHMLTVATGWQVSTLWPLYLLAGVFAPTLLQVFGAEVVAATGALRWLAAGVLVSSLAGPAASVILMSGRSVLAMVNTLVLMAVNVGGNLLLVPRLGMAAAGAVWGFTLVVSTFLPLAQMRRTMAMSTLGAPAVRGALIATASFVPPALSAVALLGQTWAALALGGVAGFGLYTWAIARWGSVLKFDVLRSSVGVGPRS